MRVIDADSHVEECSDTWKHLDKEFYGERPIPLSFADDTAYGRHNAIWLIEGKAFPKLIGRGLHIFGTPPISKNAQAKSVSVGAQTLTDIQARLEDMDRVGIECQVVFPTLFLITTADNPKLEAALCRSYNSWMGERCSKSNNRIKFSAVMPLRNVPEAIIELRRAKDLGAVAAVSLGIVWDKELGNEDFFPFYEELCRLELPLCVHFGWGAPGLTDIFQKLGSSNFSAGILPVIMGFYSIISAGVLDNFPNLRLAFLEAGSDWVPYVVNQLDRDWDNRRLVNCKKKPSQYLRDGNIYVAVESHENIPYLMSYLGEDQLVMASDYPHGDSSHEDDMIGKIEARLDLDLRLREKILSHNPARLYRL